MKFKTNISALLLALLVFVSSNGIALFEHICNTSNTRSYSLFVAPSCENEKPVSSCCEKMGIKKTKGCCEHKGIYSKLNIEGFTEKILQLKTINDITLYTIYTPLSFVYNHQVYNALYLGVPPPDNLFIIQNLLRPTPVGLQTFRC